jgi:diguanylate cyclase (GGDEF)-like protein
VRQHEVSTAYQLRDFHGASRSVAYLLLSSAPFVFVTGVVLPRNQPISSLFAVGITCLVLAIGGVVSWSRPHLMPKLTWLAAPFISTVMITGINLVTKDASTGAQLFYLWPALYAASFLSRRVIYLSMIVLFGNEAIVVFALLSTNNAGSDLTAMILALSMTAVVVMALRSRADQVLSELATQALADSLTGLANRRSFDEKLTRAGVWARRNDGRLALLTVDVDHFKKINDTWGHAVGDRALRALAEAMRSVAPGDDDLVARLGGDEFAMLLRCDRPSAMRAAEALRVAVAAIDVLPGGPPGVSIGVAILPDDGATVEALIEASDAALYDAKTNGRGRIAAARPSPLQNIDQTPVSVPAARRP